nr:class I adenylate-forming enzyme family protein [Parahaliea mediterranea]
MESQPESQLLTEDGPFSLVEETVLGHKFLQFRNRKKSLRELLLSGLSFGDREYMVDGDVRITYEEHYALVCGYSRMLSQQFGIGSGDRVAIFAENRVEWCIAFWSVTALGAVAVAMNGWWTEAEFDHAWRLSQPKLLLGDRKRLDRLRDLKLDTHVIDWEESPLWDVPSAKTLPDVEIDEDDPAVILFTSGTTGRSKAVLISHRGELGFVQTNQFNVARGMEAAGLSLESRQPAKILGVAPFFHMSGLAGHILFSYAMGDTVVLLRGRFSAEKALHLIERERVTTWTLLGGMGPMVLECDALDQFDCSSLRSITFGGAPISEFVLKGLRERFPNAQCTPSIGYGSTETVSVPVGFGGQDFIDNPGATGRVNILHELQIRDTEGRECPPGKNGQIWVRSPFSMLEYWDNTAATQEVFDDRRWLATGDVGRIESGLLWVNSRARDMILRSAENIYPVEIENRLDAHPDVIESAVIAIEHPIHGQVPGACVVLRDAEVFDPKRLTDTLARWVGDGLAPFKVPEHWYFATTPLPRNASGKVLKQEIERCTQSATSGDFIVLSQ